MLKKNIFLNSTIGIFCILTLTLIQCNVANSNKNTSAESPEKTILIHEEVRDSFGTDTVSTGYLMGKYEPSERVEFTKIEALYTNKPAIYLRKEAYKAFKRMYEAAKKDGVQLKILSATRNFDYQKDIWERKWNDTPYKKIKLASKRAAAILEYSAMPGTSRHHWGTDIDLNSLNGGDFESGEGLKIYNWLSKNANTYGFCQPYTKKGEERPNGYNEEKWHWSYQPIAEKLTKLAEKQLKNDAIKGFQGSEAAVSLKVVENYVLGINQECTIK